MNRQKYQQRSPLFQPRGIIPSLLMQNVLQMTRSLMHSSSDHSHSGEPALASEQNNLGANRNLRTKQQLLNERETTLFLDRLTASNQDNAVATQNFISAGHDVTNGQSSNNKGTPAPRTQKEFEDMKRELTILLDLSVQSKMKIEKAFPEKLAKFGSTKEDWDKFGLNWHPGWREPPRYVPEVDCDPYRGACMIQACPCDSFETWPLDEISDSGAVNDPDLIRTYVYNPRLSNPEAELCYLCHHLKSDHTLWTPSMEGSRSRLVEFNRGNTERYSLQLQESIPPKHPIHIPQYMLQRYYDDHPDAPGASANSSKLRLADIEEDNRPSGMSSIMGDESDDLFGDDDLLS